MTLVLACLAKMQTIILKVQAWISSNRLRINPKKTGFLWSGIRQARERIDRDGTTGKFPDWEVKHVAWNLEVGLLLNEHLPMEEHVNSLCRFCFYEMRQIRAILRNL